MSLIDIQFPLFFPLLGRKEKESSYGGCYILFCFYLCYRTYCRAALCRARARDSDLIALTANGQKTIRLHNAQRRRVDERSSKS